MSTYYKLGSLIEGLSSTATAGGTTTLTVSSRPIQQFTGTSAQNVDLPDATTLKVGRRFDINNRSTGVLTVRDAAAATVATIPAGTQRFFIVTDISSAAGVWRTGGVTGGGSGVTAADTLSLLSGLAGMNFSNDTIESRVIATNPEEAAGNYWLTEASLPIAKQSSVAFPLNGFVYNSVGLAGAVSNTTYRYSDDMNYWLSRANANTAREEMPGHFVLNGAGYFGGGNNGANLATVEKYSDALNSWSLVASLGSARIRTPGAALGGYGFMFSGVTSPSTVVVNTHEIYDDVANTWVTRSGGMNVAKGGAGRFELEDTVYISGGYLNGGSVSASQTTTESFNYALNTFKSEAALSAARSYIAGASASGVGVLAGGTNGSNVTSVDVYYPSAKAFRAAAALASAKATMPGAGLNGSFYYTGGNGGPVATVEAYIPFAMFNLGSLKRSTATPTSILAAVKSVALSSNLPIQLRTDGDNWKTFTTGTDSALKLGEALATKFTPFGTITIAGGQDTTSEISSVEAYNESANAWSARSAIPLARQHVAGFSTRAKGYAVGGLLSGVYQSTNYEFDDITNAWATRTAITNAVYAQGHSFSIKEIGYVVSGKLSGVAVYSSTQSYDPVANSWSIKANPSIGRAHAYSFMIGDRGYFIGGWDATAATFYTNSEKYEPITDTWSNLANAIPISQADGAATAINGFGYTFGGFNSGFTVLSTVRQLNPATETWATMSTMPAGRVSSPSGSRSLGGYAYATGGSNGAANVADHYRFNSSANSWSTMTSMLSVRARGALSNPGPYRNYEVRVGIPAFYAGLGAAVWVNRVAFTAGLNRWNSRGDAIGNFVYYVGGNNGVPTWFALVDRYDDLLNTTAAFTPMGTARNVMACFTLGGLLYACTGETGLGVTLTSVVESLNQDTAAWTSRASVATATSYNSGGKLNGFGYKGAGRTGSGVYSSVVERYNPSTNSWSGVTALGTARMELEATPLEGFLYFQSGFNGAGVSNNDQYNDSANSYLARANVPLVRRGFYHGVSGGAIVIASGANGGAAFTSTDAYNPSSNVWSAKGTTTSGERDGSSGDVAGNIVKMGGSQSTGTIEEYVDSLKQVVLGMALEVK